MSEPASLKRRITFFRAAEAQDQSETGMRGPMIMSDETAAAMRRTAEASIAPGSTSKLVARIPGGFSVLLLWAKPGFLLPRHSHDSDCLYYIQSGSVLMGERELKAGDSFFVPANTVYTYSGGPEGGEILEIRYGVESYETRFSDQSPAQWAKHEDVVRTQGPLWQTLTTGPTLALHED